MGSAYSHGEIPTTRLLIQKMQNNVEYSARTLSQITGRNKSVVAKALNELKRRGVVTSNGVTSNKVWRLIVNTK